MALKVIIIGGVAGGASAAARLRRLNEDMEIVLLERGEYISFANCGLPYYIGNVIEEREKIFLMTPQKFREWYNVDVRVNSEAISIDPARQSVEITDRRSGKTYRENYDYLVLSPGAEPNRPPLPGIDNPAVFTLRTVSDMDRIYNFIQRHKPAAAVVVGAGSIGLEMAENLQARGIAVTLVELSSQVLPFLDPEMAALVQQHLREKGVSLHLNDGAAMFEETDGPGVAVTLRSGKKLVPGPVILAAGVKPELKLARDAGLDVGKGIRVNRYLQTSQPNIYALGDAIEVIDFVTGAPALIPLAGPANKQARIVANNISGRREEYSGTQGTAILKVFDLTVAATGVAERALKQAGSPCKHCIIHPGSYAGYYPGSSPMALKLIFDLEGRILGAQAVGSKGVDKRIDVIATALRFQRSVYDLQTLELSYAPPYSMAKDPVNMAGYVAGNILQGDLPVISPAELLAADRAKESLQLVDVREPDELENEGFIAGAINIPLGKLRSRMNELSKEQELVLYCAAGMRSYLAVRILMQRGFTRARSLLGGYRTYRALEKEMAGDAAEL